MAGRQGKPSHIEGIDIIADDNTVDPVSMNGDFKDLVENEMFMEEHLEIRVMPSPDKNSANHVIINCNGMNQLCIRGYKQKIKRKYVEILARMKESSYEQHTPNPMAPEQTQLIETSAHSFPFQLLRDPNERGPAWLENILAEAA